jgi:tetratricopeptide (TPR) repeat protein
MKLFSLSHCYIIIILLFLVTFTTADLSEDLSSLLATNNPDDAFILITDHYPNSSDALEFMDNYIAKHPDQYGAYGIKGWIFNDQNRYIEALGDFDHGVALSKYKIETLRFFLTGRAHSLFGLKQESEALTRADQVIDNQDINIFGGNLSLAEAYRIKGKVHYNMSEYSKAMDAFQKANELKPNDSNIWLNIGNSYYQLNDNPNALKAYNTSIEIQPTADSYYYMGLTLRKLGQFDDAIKAFKEVLLLDPDYKGIYQTISDTKAQLGTVE